MNSLLEKIKRAAQDKDKGKPGAEKELRRLIERLRKQSLTSIER